MSDETAEVIYWNEQRYRQVPLPPDGVLRQGEALPVRVTASMWVEAKGRTPDAALIGLHREVDRWHQEEGWALEDGKISVVRWEGEYQAEAVLTRTVKW